MASVTVLIKSLQAFAFEYINPITNAAIVSLDATAVSPTDEAPAKAALMTVDENCIRWRCDPDAPDTTIALLLNQGHLMSGSDHLIIYGNQDLVNFRVIATGTSTALHITYLR